MKGLAFRLISLLLLQSLTVAPLVGPVSSNTSSGVKAVGLAELQFNFNDQALSPESYGSQRGWFMNLRARIQVIRSAVLGLHKFKRFQIRNPFYIPVMVPEVGGVHRQGWWSKPAFEWSPLSFMKGESHKKSGHNAPESPVDLRALYWLAVKKDGISNQSHAETRHLRDRNGKETPFLATLKLTPSVPLTSDPCILCQRIEVKKRNGTASAWRGYVRIVNDYPIVDDSFMVADTRHVPQALNEQQILDWFEHVQEYPNYLFSYSGEHAGPSIPFHLHGHLIPASMKLPVESFGIEPIGRLGSVELSQLKDYPARGFILEGRDLPALASVQAHLIQLLKERRLSYDFAVRRQPLGNFRVYLFPRAKEIASSDAVNPRFGSVEMCGWICSMTDEAKYRALTAEYAGAALRDVSIDDETHLDLLNTLKREISAAPDLGGQTPKEEPRRTNRTLSLEDDRCSDPLLVGNKAANLHELATIPGIKTPPGFVIPTTVYTEHLRLAGVVPLVEELNAIARSWQESQTNEVQRDRLAERIRGLIHDIQRRIAEGDISDAARHDLMDSYRRSGSGRVAVRSSASAEDMAAQSFAGQYNSFLNIQGDDELIRAVKEVWRSAYNENAVFYRMDNQIPHDQTMMAVLVLNMVDAQSAGTAFTVDPETGLPNFAIHNTYGLGEAAVAGIVIPDTWTLDPVLNRVIMRRLGAKEKRIVYDAAQKTNATVNNPPAWRRQFAMDFGTAHKVWQGLKSIQDYYRRQHPGVLYLEMEYAVDPNGDVVFLQVRPETALSQKTTANWETVNESRAKASGHKVILEGGISGSLGVVEGPLRVVRTPEEASQRVQPGDILVAPNTTSAWERVFSLASGMITEIGGPGNHTAVIAREQGKPAIVGRAEAVKTLQDYDGQIVTMDATFKKVYLGAVPAQHRKRLDQIPTVYLGRDAETEENHWIGARANGQTFEARDGKRWIGKPNERTSLFLQIILRRSNDWIAEKAGLYRDFERKVYRQVFMIKFSHIHRWREDVQMKSIDELEAIFKLWIDAVNEYLEASRELTLTAPSVQRWTDAFIHLNGVMSISFPLNEVVSGLREAFFAQIGIQEPYLSFARHSAGASVGETLAEESLRLYARLLNDAARSAAIRKAIAPLVADPPANWAGTGKRSTVFYKRFMEYVRSYRLTAPYAPGMTLPLPIAEVAGQLLADVRKGRKIDLTRPLAEEYYPEEQEFQRIQRLATISALLKQDSHHLKNRGQWKFMMVLKPFHEFLVREGAAKTVDEIYNHGPRWLVDQVRKYQDRPELQETSEEAAYPVKTYRTPVLPRWSRKAA